VQDIDLNHALIGKLRCIGIIIGLELANRDDSLYGNAVREQRSFDRLGS